MTDVDLISYAAREAVAAAMAKVRKPEIVNATVIELSADRTAATVAVDSPFPEQEEQPGVQVLDQYLLPGDKVKVLLFPPAGSVILGRRPDVELWRQIGVDQNPAWIGSWGPAPDTGILGDNTKWALPAFRLQDGRCELRGRSQRATGSLNPSSQTILPFGPRNRMMFATGFGDIAVPSFVIVNPDGLVQALFIGAANGTAPDGFVSWDGITFLVD